MKFEPTEGWEHKNRPSRDCAAVRRNLDEPVWLSFPCHGYGIGRLGVLCKKVINPDCQYVLRSSNSCTWDDLDKKCYEIASIEILAPALKGGKDCPDPGIKRECVCKAASDYQKDEDRMASGCDSSMTPDQKREKSCPLVADQSMSRSDGASGIRKTGLAHLAAITVSAILMNKFLG